MGGLRLKFGRLINVIAVRWWQTCLFCAILVLVAGLGCQYYGSRTQYCKIPKSQNKSPSVNLDHEANDTPSKSVAEQMLNLKSKANAKINQVFNVPGEDQCFCQLEGVIEDCTCQVDTVDKFNNVKIYPRLQSLLRKDYFKYYQTNLSKQCPFWSDDSQCSMEFCQVQECTEDEVPVGLKGQRGTVTDFTKKVKPLKQQAKKSCEDDLGYINTTISEASQEGFERWKIYDDSLVDFCSVRDDEADADLQYVDLTLNPERFTGYSGPSAHRVWGSIYQENCFKDTSSVDLMAPFKIEGMDESCIEKRTFYRAISGLHASINIHLSSKYLLTDTKKSAFLKPKTDNQIWGPNLTEFRQHFDSTLTQGQSPAWLKNLYFLYLLELKAIWKLAPFLRSFNLYTGNPEEDADVKSGILDFVGVVEAFPSHFEESALFSRQDALKLKTEFHQRFTNITRIMDCVGCQKCKLWGKLQVKGLGTALKILFSKPFQLKQIADYVTRNELVALINGFGRLSESVFELENFRRLIKEESAKGENNRLNGFPGLKMGKPDLFGNF